MADLTERAQYWQGLKKRHAEILRNFSHTNIPQSQSTELSQQHDRLATAFNIELLKIDILNAILYFVVFFFRLIVPYTTVELCVHIANIL